MCHANWSSHKLEIKPFVKGYDGDKCISPVVLKNIYCAVCVAAPNTLGWPNYRRSTQVVCCKNLKLFMKVWSLNPLNHFRSQSKTIKKKEALQKATVPP